MRQHVVKQSCSDQALNVVNGERPSCLCLVIFFIWLLYSNMKYYTVLISKCTLSYIKAFISKFEESWYSYEYSNKTGFHYHLLIYTDKSIKIIRSYIKRSYFSSVKLCTDVNRYLIYIGKEGQITHICGSLFD
nr:hypothetical protein [Cressdnaviricota sp.]